MKKLLFLLCILFCVNLSAQIVVNGPGTFVWTDSAPTHNPGASGAKFAVNKNTFQWYEWLSGTAWIESGDRIQSISGCSAPNYTPGNHQSRIVINNCTPTPELYVHVSGTTWAKLNGGTTYTAGTGINISGTTIEADTAILATQYDLSQAGVSWPLLAPDGSITAPSYSFSNSTETGLWLRPARFSVLDLVMNGATRTGGLPGVGISATAGGSDSGNGGNVSFKGGESSTGNGGGLFFAGGFVSGSDPTKRGGDILFSGGGSPDGIGGDIIFQTGSGMMGGTLVLRAFYTPTSSADTRGEQGSFASDENYIYIKTDTGWKRASLSAF